MRSANAGQAHRVDSFYIKRMTIRCYAQRLLNPLRGTINIISYKSAEAVTTDGVQWDIYVRNEELVADLENANKIQTSDIRYGRWSAKNGLKRGPLHPSEDFKRMEHRGAIVYERLLQLHERIPFPFHDDYELWLLDRENKPLALLDSAVAEEDLELEQSTRWLAGQACHRSFHSTALNPQPSGAAEQLERYVNSRAGDSPAAQWFHRQTDGSGTGMAGIDLPNGLENRTLAQTDFPPLALEPDKHTAPYRQLIQDFFAWQAPCLLLLAGLDKNTRARLEIQARKRALAVSDHYRLYPEIINDKEIKAACVEALMRKSQPHAETTEDILSPFYIELSSNPRQ